jgi:glycosyltransferase involved in cell wall biosynthesis
MRVTYIHQYFTTRDGAGGTRSYEVARRLVAKGDDVVIVTSDAFLPERLRSRWPVHRFEIDGISIIAIRSSYSNHMTYPSRIVSFFIFAALASYLGMGTRADVVFASSTPLTVVIPGFLSSRAQRCALVFEVRDLWPTAPIEMGALRQPLAIHLARALERWAYRVSDLVIALSPGIAKGVVQTGAISRARVFVVPNGCDVDLFGASRGRDASPLRSRLSRAAGEGPLVVYAGTLGRVNGVEYLAEIAAEMRPLRPDARFLVVGDGWGRHIVECRARELGILNESFFIWEPVPKRDVAAILASATIVTSIFKPIPAMRANSANKFFDGLAAGRALAINYGGWQADLLRVSGAGVVLSEDDARDAARTLAHFLRDSSRIREAEIAARQLAATMFDRDRLADDVRSILTEAVEGLRGSRDSDSSALEGTVR